MSLDSSPSKIGLKSRYIPPYHGQNDSAGATISDGGDSDAPWMAYVREKKKSLKWHEIQVMKSIDLYKQFFEFERRRFAKSILKIFVHLSWRCDQMELYSWLT